MIQFNDNLPITRVYVASFPFAIADESVCSARAEEIKNCVDEKVRQRKFFSWKLLEIAIKQTFGKSLAELDVSKTEYGKWICSDVEFSISHSDNVVAVAVSNFPVGVDVEKINANRFNERMRCRILTDKEMNLIVDLSENERACRANELWCVKEAVFKRDGGEKFVAKAIETSDIARELRRVVTDDGEFILAVVSNALQAEFVGVNVCVTPYF